MGDDADYPTITDLSESSRGTDITKAKKAGYNPDIPSVYPEPCSDDIKECKLFYDDIFCYWP